MMVKDIIEKLKTFEPDAPVMIETDKPGEFLPIRNIIPVPFVRGDDRMIAVLRQ